MFQRTELTFRSIRFYAPELSRLPPRVFYWGFISADVLCLVLQAIGGAMSSQSSGSSQTGVDVAMAGLILQVIVIVFFLLLLVAFVVSILIVLVFLVLFVLSVVHVLIVGLGLSCLWMLVMETWSIYDVLEFVEKIEILILIVLLLPRITSKRLAF